MSTTLENAMLELSEQIGDDFSGTTTSSGSSTTVVDTTLKAYPADWIDATSTLMWDRITSGTYDEEERRISSLAIATGTLTTIAHGGTIASAVTYEVHRLFSASEKRKAIINAARDAFPSIHKKIDDETKTTGNWLRNGSFENWAASTYPDSWTLSALTAAKNTTLPYYKHGIASMKLSTAAGNMSQSASNLADLHRLAGKSVTFTIQGWCDTASCLRLQIYDGTTTTSSDYHGGGSDWTKDSEPLSVTATIADTPTEITFRVVLASAAGTAYVDDARVIGPYMDRIYIGDLGLANNEPYQVYVESSDYTSSEPWVRIRGWKVDSENYLCIPNCRRDRRLRITGIGVLNFLKTGAVSTDWAATIGIDSPQTDILVAKAAVNLYAKKVMPDEESGETDQYARGMSYWDRKLKSALSKHAMKTPTATTQWGM